MESPMQFQTGDHVAQFTIFIGLAWLKFLTACHGDRILKALLKSTKITQIGRGRNWYLASKLTGISRHCAESYHTAIG